MSFVRKKTISVVEQKPVLVNDTIYNNLILFSDSKPTQTTLNYYISMFKLEEFIMKSENGLDTIIDQQTSNLSGGEKQKITIIRELLKNPSLLILDEPTSAMDLESKENFYLHLKEIKKDKIIVLISHENNIKDYCDFTIRL